MRRASFRHGDVKATAFYQVSSEAVPTMPSTTMTTMRTSAIRTADRLLGRASTHKSDPRSRSSTSQEVRRRLDALVPSGSRQIRTFRGVPTHRDRREPWAYGRGWVPSAGRIRRAGSMVRSESGLKPLSMPQMTAWVRLVTSILR